MAKQGAPRGNKNAQGPHKKGYSLRGAARVVRSEVKTRVAAYKTRKAKTASVASAAVAQKKSVIAGSAPNGPISAVKGAFASRRAGVASRQARAANRRAKGAVTAVAAARKSYIKGYAKQTVNKVKGAARTAGSNINKGVHYATDNGGKRLRRGIKITTRNAYRKLTAHKSPLSNNNGR